MRRLSISLALLAFLVAVVASKAADATVSTATGKVEKTGKGTVTIQARKPDGTFGKTLVLKITGTSTFSKISLRGKKDTVVQTEAKAKDLKKNQSVAVIYTTTKDAMILLSAVIQPSK